MVDWIQPDNFGFLQIFKIDYILRQKNQVEAKMSGEIYATMQQDILLHFWGEFN